MSGKIIIEVSASGDFATGVHYGELQAPSYGRRLFQSPLPIHVERYNVLRHFDMWRTGEVGGDSPDRSNWTHWAAECMVVYPDCFFVEVLRPGRNRKTTTGDLAPIRNCIRHRLLGSLLASEVRNRMRRYSAASVNAALESLVEDGDLVRSIHPVNKSIRYEPSAKGYASHIHALIICPWVPEGGLSIIEIKRLLKGPNVGRTLMDVLRLGQAEGLFRVQDGKITSI